MISDIIRVLCVVLVIALARSSTEPQALKPPASDFKKYVIVQPVVQNSRTRRHIITTRDTTGAHHEEVILRLTVDGEELILDLRLNQDLLPDNHKLWYQKNGKTVVYKPKKEEVDLCHYGGTVRGKPGSWVAVSTCNGLQGTVFDGHTMRYIEPAQGDDISSQHYIYDHSDLSVSHKCGNNDTSKNELHYPQHKRINNKLQTDKISRSKRNADDARLHAPYNANGTSRYVELVFVADYRQFIANDRNIYKVYQEMKSLANIVNSVYSPLNIFIALTGAVVWNQNDKIRLSSNSSKTLEDFLDYRKNELVRDIPHDNAHLLTSQHFTEGIVGKAYTGAICSSKLSGGISSIHTDVTGLQAMTIAHEMGHNFGMDHDKDDLCECPDKICIMAASSSASITPSRWSTCSLEALAYSFWKGLDYCLRNIPKRLLDSQPTCGNGFVEPGEQCDCGTRFESNSNDPCHACCNPDTCRLRANATCGAGTCCDLKSCSLKSAGTECRSAERECDLPEFCTGESEFCPDDLHKMDSLPCGEGEKSAYCVRGNCRSHLTQCRLLWGPTANDSYLCYAGNTAGTLYGNCGHDHLQDLYAVCEPHDVRCGRLQCSYLGNKLHFSISHAETGTRSFTRGGKLTICHTATIDMGLNDVDPGLVPDGAKCGDQKMCWNQQCVSVDDVRKEVISSKSVCPSDCSGHGVCNSAGECHCEPGFAPPLCEEPGLGGSYSSGPATNAAIQRNLMIALFAIFLAIIPLILLILFLIYYFRPELLFRCNVYLQQKLVYNKYFDEYLSKRKSPKPNTDLSRKSQQRPDIVHHYKCIPKNDNNPLLENNSENKTTSVIYANIETIRNFEGKSSKENVDNLANVKHTNSKVNKINLSSSTSPDSNSHFVKTKVNLPCGNGDKVEIKNIRLPNDSFPKPPVKVTNPPSNSLGTTSKNVINKSPSDNLRKNPLTITKSPCEVDTNLKTPEIVVNLFNIKLRKTDVNKARSPSDNYQEKTENNVDLHNVTLRKTPGNIIKSNVENSGNPNKNLKKAPHPKPVRKFTSTDSSISNNKDVKVGPSTSEKFHQKLNK